MRREENRAFLPALRRLERRLALPIPRRIRLLRELEWDLEEIRDDLEARGVAPEEARDRALEILLPGEASVLELTRLHRPFYRKVTRNLAHDRITLMERGALGLMTVVVLGVQVAALRHTETLGSPSPFLWVVLLWGTLLFLFLLAKAFQLWVKGDHGNPEQGLDALLGLVALTLTLAVVSRWRFGPYAFLWRHLLIPLVGPPGQTEAAAPHRFAKLIGATFTLGATPLVVIGGPFALAGYVLAGIVAVLAGLAATTGFCLGCRLYGQLAVARRLDLV